MAVVCLLLVNADILDLKSGIAANVNMTLQYSGQTLLPYNVGQYTVVVHSVPLVFLTKTKKSMDFFTFVLQIYIRQIRISWKNYLPSGFQNSNPQKMDFFY